MFKSLFLGLISYGLSIASAFAEAPPVSQNGEPLPQVEGLSAKQVAAIAAAIVTASIAAYRAGASGPCACPDDVDRGGRKCGRRSARDRAGGWTVYCYLSDVPAALIKERAGLK